MVSFALLTIVLSLIRISISKPTASKSIETRQVYWQPQPPLKWQIVSNSDIGDPNLPGIDVYDVDLYSISQEDLNTLKKNGKKVICYFSAGTWEDWRPDADQFDKTELGNEVGKGEFTDEGFWPGEYWLNIRSQSVVDRMIARLQDAKDKGCDGVDPDNIDGFDKDRLAPRAQDPQPNQSSRATTGFSFTQTDAIVFLQDLAAEAHQRGLSIGVKNSLPILDQVSSLVDYAINEQCVANAECAMYEAFLNSNKPVFHVEYASTDDLSTVSEDEIRNSCASDGVSLISPIVKTHALDS
ncbi:hypothetical protein HYFRA_00007302, partial [Hymenoscyphus fraxineus]